MLANSFAAQSELGLRSMEYNALWQKRRDDAQMLYDSTERDLERVAQAAALAQQAALAKSSQKASRTSSIFGTIGSIAGAAIAAGCWVAREVYGNDAQEVYRFRWWLEREAPKWFNRLYKKRGEKFAYFITFWYMNGLSDAKEFEEVENLYKQENFEQEGEEEERQTSGVEEQEEGRGG